MDNKAAERVVIAKPVASRPTCSSFKSFADILACAFNTSPPKTSSETMVSAIRPKTARFKLKDNPAPSPRVISSDILLLQFLLFSKCCTSWCDIHHFQAKISETLPGTTSRSSSENLTLSDSKSTVLFKPLAKHVSKRTVSQLSLMVRGFIITSVCMHFDFFAGTYSEKMLAHQIWFSSLSLWCSLNTVMLHKNEKERETLSTWEST